MTISEDVQLGRIQGTLETFQSLHEGANDCYAFLFDQLESKHTLEKSVLCRLESECGVTKDTLQLEPIGVFDDRLRQSLTEWLFDLSSRSITQDEEAKQRIVES